MLKIILLEGTSRTRKILQRSQADMTIAEAAIKMKVKERRH